MWDVWLTTTIVHEKNKLNTPEYNFFSKAVFTISVFNLAKGRDGAKWKIQNW